MRPYAKSDIPNADRAFGSFGSGNITVELVNRLGREIVLGSLQRERQSSE
jgi:hypothetical protein